MILTGPEIRRAVTQGSITIDPFDPKRLSPNAYDWRLGDHLYVCETHLDAARPSSFRRDDIPEEGYVLDPGVLYLGVTLERTGSETYAQFLNGNHDIGSLGIWVHISAPLGHTGHNIAWTLELCCVRPVRVYAGMTFGKLVFFETHGARQSYQERGLKYTSSAGVEHSKLYTELGPR